MYGNKQKIIKQWDVFFDRYLFGINTLDFIQGITGAFAWGVVVVFFKSFLAGKASPGLINGIAFLLASLSQKIINTMWLESELYADQTADKKFINTIGLKILKDIYKDPSYVYPQSINDQKNENIFNKVFSYSDKTDDNQGATLNSDKSGSVGVLDRLEKKKFLLIDPDQIDEFSVPYNF